MKKVILQLRKIGIFLYIILSMVIVAVAALLCFSIQWMFKTWNNLSMDELMYHMQAPLDGTNESMVREYLSVCAVPAILILLLGLVIYVSFKRNKKYYVFAGISVILAVMVSGAEVYSAWNKLGAGSYIQSQGTYSTFIDDYYVNPAEVAMTFPEQKRNLIMIFLESMETTYADQANGGAFDENVIPELTRIAQEGEDFSGEDKALNGGVSLAGTTWTMGAMFAHTSGLPLNVSIGSNDMDTQETFFDGAITMGDVLEQAGYSQTLLIGSEAVFGGRELYFTHHGNYAIEDYTYARENGLIPEDYRVFWGYEDQKLFGFAKEKLLELASKEEPFNLTMLTVDTHFEDGYLCEKCPDIYEEQYSNVMLCSSAQLDEFIRWIQNQDFYENTSIVLVGDHPTMDSDFCEDVDQDYLRRVYTAYINAAATPELQMARKYTTLDTFPTVMGALGVQMEGNRLGLGTNLFSSEQTLTERFEINQINEELKKKSVLMEELSDIDENSEELIARYTVDPDQPTATVRIYRYNSETGKIPITVTDVENMPNSLAGVQVAIWKQEDQSDLQWIELKQQEDGSYMTYVDMSSYAYEKGNYMIHVSVLDADGESYVVGIGVGMVK